MKAISQYFKGPHRKPSTKKAKQRIAPRRHQHWFSKKRPFAALLAALIMAAVALPHISSSHAAYSDVATGNMTSLGSPSSFALEVKNNGVGNVWSNSTTEATSAVLKGSANPKDAINAVSKSMILNSSVRVKGDSPVSGRITPTLKAPAACTETCKTLSSVYVRVSAWWGTAATPKATQISNEVSVAEFNLIANRSIIGHPGEEHLLTLEISLAELPVDPFGGTVVRLGVVYDGVSDASLS